MFAGDNYAPGFSLRSNPGLELANAFGVVQFQTLVQEELTRYTALPMTPQPTIIIRTSPRISAIRVVLGLLALFVAIFLGLLVLLLI